MNITTIADDMMRRGYTQHGVHTLACDCGHGECVVDRDALGNQTDIVAVAALIEHARHDHVSPRSVLATVHHTALDTLHLDVMRAGR
jgi:hypothetical protein